MAIVTGKRVIGKKVYDKRFGIISRIFEWAKEYPDFFYLKDCLEGREGCESTPAPKYSQNEKKTKLYRNYEL